MNFPHNPTFSRVEVYRFLGSFGFPVGSDTHLLCSPLGREPILLQRGEATMLRSCQTFATLEEHAERLRHTQGERQTGSSLIAMLSRFVESGLLVAKSEILSKLAQLSPSGSALPPLAAIAIPTKGRVGTLERALRSYIQNSQQFGRSLRFVIADDSDSATAMQNRAMLESLKKQTGAKLFYAGNQERETFAAKLAQKAAVPLGMVRFALLNPGNFPLSTGASRNSLLLETTGELLLQVDDDTICRVAAVPQSSQTATFSARRDATEFWFFPDFEAAMQSAEFVEQDFVGLHESILGKSLGDCVSSFAPVSECDIHTLDADFLQRMKEGAGTVKATFAGVLGDSGIGKSGFYLFLEEPSLSRLTESEQKYRSLLMSRYVLRSVRRPTFSTGDFCSSINIGLDHRGLLPPFVPVQRGQDSVFGKIVHACFRNDYAGFFPWAVVHAPQRPAPAWSPLVWNELSLPATGDVFSAIVSFFSSTTLPQIRNPDRRLAALGQYLADLGTLPSPDFQQAIRGMLWHGAGQTLIKLEQQLQKHGDKRSYWRDDLKRCLEAMRWNLGQPSYGIPIDLLEAYGCDRAPVVFQKLVCEFGHLLQCWREIVEAAGALRRQGEPLAKPI